MSNNPVSTTEEDDGSQALVNDLQSLESELTAQKDLYLRLAADFENFRKRTGQEIDRRAAAQKEEFIRELLPVIDNLERALAHADAASPQQLRQGVEMTLQQLKQLLRRHGIEADPSLGEQFDPHRHEAVATRQDDSQPDHVVLETFQEGYRRGDKVFRPAKVVVNHLAGQGA